MKSFHNGAFDEGFDMDSNCFCESKKEGERKLVIMVDESQECETILTGLPFQEVFIDLSECKANIKKPEEEKNCKDTKKRKH